MKISQARQEAIIKECEELIRKRAPKDTGNLAYNAIRVESKGNGVWEIYIDSEWETGIAPYMKYTNENWAKFKPPLQGKQNPNEGWFNRVAEEIAVLIAERLKGKAEKQ